MPQIKVEYTSNIEFPVPLEDFFRELHKIVSIKGNCNIENCKSRLIRLTDYFIGNLEEKSAFIHLELRFLEGRTEEIKINLGRSLLIFLKNTFIQKSNKNFIQITVQIIDINRMFYFKYPEGTFTQL